MSATRIPPGPWSMRHPHGPDVVDAGGDLVVSLTYEKETPDDVCDAIERLIAAAPILLSAAKKFLAFYEDLAKSNPGFMGKLALQNYQQWNEALMELPAAIAKAEGRK